MGLLIAAIRVYSIVLIVQVVFSWLPPRARANELYEFTFRATEPVLRPVRRALPPTGGMDLSLLIVFLALAVLARLLAGA